LDEPWRYSAKWNKPVIKGQTSWFCLYQLPGGITFIGTENRMVFAGSWGLENGGVSSLMVQSFSLARWKSCGDGWWWCLYDNVKVLNVTENG
jgi:hypothetical protein